MFTYVSQLLYRFQSKPLRTALLCALAMLILTVALVSFVRWLRRRRNDRPESWTGLVVEITGSVLKVLVGLAIACGLALHLRFQSDEFARLRGGITQRSYSAVQTIWGRPHLQKELSVTLLYKTTHLYDKDGMEMDPDKLRATTRPIGFKKVDKEHVIGGNPITEADHEFQIWMNYRRKGGAEYPGFETNAAFTYRLVNFSGRDVIGRFRFPLPRRQGLIDNFTVMLDGKPISRRMVVSGESASWEMPLKADQAVDLTVTYHSRGLDHLRLEPGAGRELKKYRVRMICKGIAKHRINYPIGCMTPTELTERDGNTVLAWNLDHAVTRLGMGVILPKRKQGGYYVARVLAAAPWGLALLLGMVLVTFLAAGQKLHCPPLLLLAVAYHLYYLLMAHLGDYWPGLVGGMIISGVVLTALMMLLFFRWTERTVAIRTVKFFILFCIVYPLMRISDYEGLLLTMLYVAMLAYVILLVIRQPRPAGE